MSSALPSPGPITITKSDLMYAQRRYAFCCSKRELENSLVLLKEMLMPRQDRFLQNKYVVSKREINASLIYIIEKACKQVLLGLLLKDAT